MSEQQQAIRVHHYKRTDARGEGAKELVTEIVVEGSDTGRFLKKMEETRLTRPCFQTLDMRGRVLGDCKRYVFNDRVHYMDDISYALFQKGLAENRGVYTVGTFEAIIFGAHTIDAMKEAEEAERQSLRDKENRRQQRYAQESRVHESDDGTPRTTTITFYNPEVVPFGYFRQREEGRLQYATGVMLSGKAGTVKAVSRDISVGGAQAIVKGPCPFEVDQEVEAYFTGLEGQAGGASKVKGIRYRVASLTRREAESVLGLQRLDRERPVGFSALIENMIERYERKYKLDVEDEYLSTMAMFYERAYTESVTQIPFFAGSLEGKTVLQAVALSDANKPLMQFFSNEFDHYDFQFLQLEHRLEKLRELGSLQIVLYRDKVDAENYQIHSAADCEFSDPADFDRFLRHAMTFQEHMILRVRVENALAHSLDEHKAEHFLQRLSYKSAEVARSFRTRLQDLLFVGGIVDVTQQVREGMELLGTYGQPADTAGLQCWVGDRQIGLGAAGASEADFGVAEPDYLPDIIRFGYVERRREDRYQVETAVNIMVDKQQFSGTTCDISTRGMRIRLAEHCELEKGKEVRVALVKLQKKKSGTNLMNIPYRVVKQEEGEQGCLMLERIVGRSQEGLSKFFVELITKNQQRLTIDAGDIWSATAARAYEGLFALNNAALPFFIGRNEAGVTVVQRVAVPMMSNRLAQFFQGPDGEFEFFPVGDPRLVLALNDSITSIQRQSGTSKTRAPHCELEMFCYKEADPDTGEEVLRWSSELELASDAAREAFIQKAMTYDEYRFVKIAATFVVQPTDKQMDKLLEPVRLQSKHRALKLGEQLRSVMGYGEIIDITEDMASARKALVAEMVAAEEPAAE